MFSVERQGENDALKLLNTLQRSHFYRRRHKDEMAIFVDLSVDFDPLKILTGLQSIPVTNLFADRSSGRALLNPVVTYLSGHRFITDEFVVAIDCHEFATGDSVRGLKNDWASSSFAQKLL